MIFDDEFLDQTNKQKRASYALWKSENYQSAKKFKSEVKQAENFKLHEFSSLRESSQLKKKFKKLRKV